MFARPDSRTAPRRRILPLQHSPPAVPMVTRVDTGAHTRTRTSMSTRTRTHIGGAQAIRAMSCRVRVRYPVTYSLHTTAEEIRKFIDTTGT
eukprot:4456473-Prymnesium_polylepis.1